MTRDNPPIPPCRSRAKKVEGMDGALNNSMMGHIRIFLRFDILLYIFTLAVLDSYVMVIVSKTEQILCASGYSDQFGGLLIVIMVITGWAAVGLLGYIIGKTGHMLAVAKVMLFFLTLCIVINTYLIRIPYQYYGLGVVFGLLGGFTIGGAAICVEIMAEVTYPTHQAIRYCNHK